MPQNLAQVRERGFIVGGVFAGGNLACVAAHLARDEKLFPPLTGVWLDEPNFILAWCQRSGKSTRAGSSVNPTRRSSTRPTFNGHYKPDPASPLFSPLIWPSGHNDLPPHFIFL
ncbi:hypothetical protein AOQ84DRAFT_222850 [Glonium stellatum]|uniref:Alpha/beta hydrolase fold-3 domain-containing protein n=1 Tax=Glonium stellatum TaxID=574774 RepID=A0A8E2EYW0_9PEZI|nr:hypothetical protein AOQ84DRAFT_222850 [Glonium stellatum]